NHPNCLRLVRDFDHLITTRLAPAVPERNRLIAALGAFYERQWRRAEQLKLSLREIGVEQFDLILVPHLEVIGLWQLALRRNLFGGKPWATIAIGLSFHHKSCGIEAPRRVLDVLQAVFFKRVVRNPTLTCLGTVNPYLSEFARNAK